MRTFLLYLAFILTLSVFVYGALKQYAEGSELKFNTQKTRELWQVCSVSFRSKHPGIPIHVYYPVCDCYVDHIRSSYEPEVLDNMTSEEVQKLSEELKFECNPQEKEEFT